MIITLTNAISANDAKNNAIKYNEYNNNLENHKLNFYKWIDNKLMSWIKNTSNKGQTFLRVYIGCYQYEYIDYRFIGESWNWFKVEGSDVLKEILNQLGYSCYYFINGHNTYELNISWAK